MRFILITSLIRWYHRWVTASVNATPRISDPFLRLYFITPLKKRKPFGISLLSNFINCIRFEIYFTIEINPDHLALDLKYYPISLRSMSSRLIVLRISVCMMCQNLWSFQVLSWYIQQQMTLPITDNVHVHLAGHGNAVAFLERSLAFILLWRHFKPIEYVMNVPDPPEWPCCEPYVRTLLSCTCGNYTTYSN